MSGWSIEAMDATIANKGDAQDDSPESGEHEVRAEGEHHVKDVLERSFERGESVGKKADPEHECEGCAPGECGPQEDPAPCSEPADGEEDRLEDEAAKAATEPAPMSREESYPDLSNVTVTKVPHRNLILDGVCSHCAHCGHQLTDAESVQRGIGPVCSNKGYAEEPVDADEMQALIDLAEFPELVDFLMEHYKPLGIRGLVNGLVRVASLNRPRGRDWIDGNVKVHSACCDAIQSLGHKLMAELLRETLVIMAVKDADGIPGSLQVWVKKRDWTKYFSYDLKLIPGAYFSRKHKGNIVPVHDPSDPKRPKMTGRSRTTDAGRTVPETNKAALWAIMLKHYEGCVAKVNGKVVKIGKK
jgi:hypothetical protein